MPFRTITSLESQFGKNGNAALANAVLEPESKYRVTVSLNSFFFLSGRSLTLKGQLNSDLQ